MINLMESDTSYSQVTLLQHTLSSISIGYDYSVHPWDMYIKKFECTMKEKSVDRLAADTACAISAAAAVSPFISIIDTSIFANASGRMKLSQGLTQGFKTFLLRPHQFIKQPAFLLIWGVYTGTYIVANSIETVCVHKGMDWFYPKFVGTSIANVLFSVMKDLYLTKAFGKVDVATKSGSTYRPVPKLSYACYTARDSMTIFASFNLPPLISQLISQQTGCSVQKADTVAQLVTPCGIQLLSTPLHLLGMDLYNNPHSNVSQRIQFVQREYAATAAARMGRIFPAYGIGGVLNKAFRKSCDEYLQMKYKL